MRIDVLTLFPEMFESVINSSIFGRALKAGIFDIRLHNIRDYTLDKHRRTDDYPFGGGAGMVMTPQPLFDCFDAVIGDAQTKPHCIYMSPQGKTLTHDKAAQLSMMDRIVILCGHYEGVDQRVIDTYIDEEISIGDYVLTGGELPAMVMMDCLSRFIPGVLGRSESAHDESFSGGLLEYPQYTRPADFRGQKVPDVLLSGNHAKIDEWRIEESIKKTKEVRPELLEKLGL
ncbi:MAG: tRNA (guanosine(37)-N1)-methyltransferase TrmD [Clostridiales bacterium]|nr:tRNA (guanosine(37)-N1)-methyltransferase TrmD [Clostridiales bacterium]